eukprot:Skav225594  [mRNA]  locus=scaffold1527:168505:176565:- [translate_table: standard]
MKSSFRYHMGAAAPYKTNGLGCVGGKHVGVGFLSSFAARNQTAGWSHELFQTARIHAARFHVGQTWVHGGVAYGYAAGSETASVREQTELLLQQLTKQVEPDQRGLKFIGGDFNQHHGKLQECKLWEEYGWKELQSLGMERWNIPPGVTCKGKSRKDFVYLSPDLQRLLLGVVNQSDPFPDHHVLYGRTWILLFSMMSACESPALDGHANTTQQFASIMQQFEQAVDEHRVKTGKSKLSSAQRGRGQTTERHVLPNKPSPPKPGRPGDPQVTFGGWKPQHSRWYAQLKRLVNFRNMSHSTRIDVTFMEHRVSLWHAIRRASGFQPNFVTWWNSNHPKAIPEDQPPKRDQVCEIVDQFAEDFRVLEDQLNDSRNHQVKHLYSKDTNRVFRDVKQSTPAPLEVIIADQVAEVVEVPTPDTVVLASEVPFDTAKLVQVGDRNLAVIEQLGSKIWFTEDHDIAPGDTILQIKELGIEAVYRPKAGANPMVQLSLVDPCMHDPECYAVVTTVMQFRKYADPILVRPLLADVYALKPSQRKPGPGGALAGRLERINWQWVQGTTFLDDECLPADILVMPLQELVFRLHRSWSRLVGSLQMERDDFHGLSNADFAHSKISPAWSLEEHSMLRVLQIGTFCTADKLHAAKVVDTPSCKFCSAPDSLLHRNLHCPATAPLRARVPSPVMDFVDAAMPCIHRGWLPEPSHLVQYKQQLLQIPDDVTKFEQVPCSCDSLDVWDLFIDGSAQHPKIPCARLASWAVVLAGPFHSATGYPLSRGFVMGLWQTVQRGELTAMISALSYAAMTTKPCRIWVDNQQVFRRTRAMQRQTWSPGPMSCDADLWELVGTLLDQVRDRVQICKVASHQDPTDAEDWELWAFRMNDYADHCARATFATYMLELVSLSNQVAAEWSFLDTVKQHWHAYLVEVAKLSIAHPEVSSKDISMEPCQSDVQVINLAQIAKHAFDAAPMNLRFSGWLSLLQWMETISHNPQPHAEWVTWYELLWSLQLTLGRRGIRAVGTNNKWEWDDGWHPYDMQKSTRYLSSWLTQIIKLVFPSWKSTHARPSCYRFQTWAMTLRLQWNHGSRVRLNDWLQERLGNQEIKQLRLLYNQPEACQGDQPLQPLTLGLHRYGELRRILLQSLEVTEIRWSQQVLGYTERSDGLVQVQLNTGEAALSHVLVACDGVKSPVRQQKLQDDLRRLGFDDGRAMWQLTFPVTDPARVEELKSCDKKELQEKLGSGHAL